MDWSILILMILLCFVVGHLFVIVWLLGVIVGELRYPTKR